MYRRFCLPLLMLLTLSVAGSAHAYIITYDNYLDRNSAGSGSIAVSQFDPSMGTLTAVTVRIYQFAAATFRFDNDDDVDRTAQASMVRVWTLNGASVSDSASDNFTSSSVALSADNGDGDSIADYTAPDGQNWGMVTGGGLHNTFNIASGNWAAYTGLSTVTYAVNVSTLLNGINTDANSYQSQIINGVPSNQRIRVYVDYEYTSEYIPEPGTMALLCLGLGGLGAWRRRRAAAAA